MTENPGFQQHLLNQLSSFLDGMKSLNARIADNVVAIGRFDTEFVKIARQNNQTHTSMLDVRSDVGQLSLDLGKLGTDLGQLSLDLGHIRTEMGQFRSDFLMFRADITQRLQAILHRIEELENAVSSNANEIRALQIEARSQYNEILNALQNGLQNNIALGELSQRVEALERRLGT